MFVPGGPSYSLMSADTVQRDLNKLGLKGADYNVHRPPDTEGGGHYYYPSLSYYKTNNFFMFESNCDFPCRIVEARVYCKELILCIIPPGHL